MVIEVNPMRAHARRPEDSLRTKLVEPGEEVDPPCTLESMARVRSALAMRPSVTVFRSSSDSVISTIASSFPGAKRGQSLRSKGYPVPGCVWSYVHRLARLSGASTTPTLGSMVQRG